MLLAGAALTGTTGTFTGVLDITDTTDSSDASGDTGALRTEGGVSIAKKLYVGTDLDVDGTTNLDAVDIDGAVQVDGAITVGTAGSGQDVTFYSGTSGDQLLWDSSEEKLVITGTDGANALEVADGNVAITDNLTVSGNFTVSGTTTTVDTTNLTVTDPLIKLAHGTTASPANDLGLIFTRGNGSASNIANRAILWDESADIFVFAYTNDEAGTTTGNVDIDDYASIRVGAITADDNSTFTGTISTATGSTIGNLTLANGSITDSSGAISFGNETLTTTGAVDLGAATLDSVTSTGDFTTTGQATDWDLIDNNASALSFDASGKAGILEIVTTNSSESVKMSGDLDVDGTTNLDAVDIDGDVQLDGTFTVGVNDTGKDVKFFGASDGAYMEWDESADQLRIMGASADATTSTGKLLLATSLTDINALGKIDFQAPHEAGGTDAITVAASIQAIAQGTFSSSVNATDLIFYTGHSEAATEKVRNTSQGEIGIGGANYGSDGQVLTSGGAGAAVAWEDAAGGGGVSTCRFMVTNSSTISCTNQTWTKATWNAEVFDVGGNFASDKFTAPSDGTYMFSASLAWTTMAVGADIAMGVYKNGSYNLTVENQAAEINISFMMSATWIMVLSEGDYIELYAIQGSGSTESIGSSSPNWTGPTAANSNWWQGWLIG